VGVMQRLLDVQSKDTHCDQLRYQLDHHETITARDGLVARLREHDELLGAVTGQRDELSARQRPLDEAVRQCEQKIAKDSEALYSGAVTAHKDLEALQHEMAAQKERQGQFEDQILELMEAAEPLDVRLEQLGADRVLLVADLERAEEALTIARAEIEAELAAEESGRAALAEGLPADLLAQYESIRRGAGGQGAALLAPGGRCEGCHLTLPRAEYERLKRAPADEVVQCPECGRILVRTPAPTPT